MSKRGISKELDLDTKIINVPLEKKRFKSVKKLRALWKPDWVVVNISLQPLESDLWSLRLAKQEGAKTIIFEYVSITYIEKIMKISEPGQIIFSVKFSLKTVFRVI